MPSVVLQGIRKVFDDGTVAVDGADISVEEGEFLVLVGPSGCGKSTTLRMIAGLETITEGSLFIDDNLVNDVAPKDRNIAMVFQNYALYPHMSVFDNMAFGLKLRKYPKQEIRERVGQAADILGLENILERKPKALSGGQRQRVAVGRAIVRHPRVFLFDEPLSNLDAKLRVQMRMEISKLHRQLGATMIYVTHDQVEAMTMGDRIVVMKDGFIEQIDTPIDLYNHPVNRFVAGFIGSPAMNFLEGSLRQNGSLTFREGNSGLSIVLSDEQKSLLSDRVNHPVTLGIRPEDISVSRTDSSENDDISDNVLDNVVIELKVELLEPMGNEIILHAGSTVHQIVARVAPQELPEPGQEIRLAFLRSKFHFFDHESGKSL